MSSIDLITASALVIGLAAMAFALRRSHPEILPSNREIQQEIARLRATVDTLQKMIEEKNAQIAALRAELDITKARLLQLEAIENRKDRVLLAVLGTDEALQVDLSVLRGVANRTGMRLTRLMPVTKTSLDTYLSRHRAQGRPVRYVHFAVHSGPNGLQFADGIADGLWLSEVLADVDVVLIAGCQSDAIGDLIGVVDTVVSMREDVRHSDAASFAGAFWTAIGEGETPEAAYDKALRTVPRVSEFAELHI